VIDDHSGGERFGVEAHGTGHIGDHEHDIGLVDRRGGHVDST
jgi:hypothetical protein